MHAVLSYPELKALKNIEELGIVRTQMTLSSSISRAKLPSWLYKGGGGSVLSRDRR